MRWCSFARFTIILISLGTSIFYFAKGRGFLVLTGLETLLLMFLVSKDT